MGLLTGKVAVVTGGSSGIGFASAAAFVEAGARVAITGRRPAILEAAVRELGANAAAIQGDVADIAHHKEVAREVARRFGGLDIYMANAGRIAVNPSTEVSEAEYDAQFAVNARATFFGVQAVLPLMRDHGAIILTGSAASETTLPGHAVYAGSKAAINAFCRNWAVELGARAIRVNVLSPGPVDTGILSELGLPAGESDAFVAATVERIALGRLGRPEEVAKAALFLASDDGSFVTGINLRVDGGMAVL